jgi:hypothetical protein
MSDLMLTYRIQATSNYCNVTTYVDATDEDQAETLGLQQIADELGMTNTNIFRQLEIEEVTA